MRRALESPIVQFSVGGRLSAARPRRVIRRVLSGLVVPPVVV